MNCRMFYQCIPSASGIRCCIPYADRRTGCHGNRIQDRGNKPTVNDIFELAEYSLKKDQEWVATCKKELATVKYSNEAKIDEKVVAQ